MPRRAFRSAPAGRGPRRSARLEHWPPDQELQQRLVDVTEGHYTMRHQDASDDLSRREALRRLALLPLELCGLTALRPVLEQPAEEILAQCAAGITACWYLWRGKELPLAFQVIATYAPTLKALAAWPGERRLKELRDLLRHW